MQKKNIIIVIGAIIAIGGAGVYGGTVYEKNNLRKQGLLRNQNNAQLGNRQGQSGQGGQGRQAGAGFNRDGGDFVNGEIIAKDEESITVKNRDGSTKIIFFSNSTQIGKATEGTAADLENGKQVMVNGKVNADGSLTAENIQLRPAQLK